MKQKNIPPIPHTNSRGRINYSRYAEWGSAQLPTQHKHHSAQTLVTSSLGSPRVGAPYHIVVRLGIVKIWIPCRLHMSSHGTNSYDTQRHKSRAVYRRQSLVAGKSPMGLPNQHSCILLFQGRTSVVPTERTTCSQPQVCRALHPCGSPEQVIRFYNERKDFSVTVEDASTPVIE